MTPFALLSSLAGLSHREAGEMLAVRIDTVKSWSSGRNRCPPGPLSDLRALIAAQQRAAREQIAQIDALCAGVGAPDEIELGYPADDYEARSLGWPCVGAWAGMAARVLSAADRPIRLVPRGSTPATAAGKDAHERLTRS